MKKNHTTTRSPMRATAQRRAGHDWHGLGDKISRYCVLGDRGEVLSEGSVATTQKVMIEKFAKMRRRRVAVEVESPFGREWIRSCCGRSGAAAK